MTNKEIVEDLRTIADYFIEQSGGSVPVALEEAIEIIGNMPEWIPCSERLPEEDGEYLVTDDSGGAKWVIESFYCMCEDGSSFWTADNPIAWMSCPEPYGGE